MDIDLYGLELDWQQNHPNVQYAVIVRLIIVNYEVTASITKDKALLVELAMFIKSMELNSSDCLNFNVQSPKHKKDLIFKYPYTTRCGYEMKSLDFVPKDNTDWVLRTDVDIIALD